MITCVYRVEVPAGMKEAHGAIRAQLKRCKHSCVHITVCIHSKTKIMINAKALSDFVPCVIATFAVLTLRF